MFGQLCVVSRLRVLKACLFFMCIHVCVCVCVCDGCSCVLSNTHNLYLKFKTVLIYCNLYKVV